MDIRQLTHFMGVATHGGFSKASRIMHISQPALTRSVQMMEDLLQVQLFERTPQGIELTQHGDILYRHASLILNSLETAKAELFAARSGAFAEVKIGMASMFNNMIVDRAVSELIKQNESITVDVKVSLYEDLAELLLEGALDLIISTHAETESAPDVEFEPLCEITSVLVAGAAHPLSKKKALQLADLKDADWVTLNQPHMETFLASFFASDGLAAPHRRVKTTSLEMLRCLLRQNQLIGFLPSHWVSDDLTAGRLCTLDLPGLPVRRTAGIVTRKSSVLNPAVEKLIEQLRLAAT